MNRLKARGFTLSCCQDEGQQQWKLPEHFMIDD